VGYERVVRILDYLYGASENHLRQIARYCYKRDIEENDVIRRVYKEVVKPGEGEDRSLLDSLRRQGQTLLQVLQKHTWRQAYV
jgi:imidazoleglycerol phosphate synthase glutamine amidotransferase subunit HisH